jgi:hypothetical protein
MVTVFDRLAVEFQLERQLLWDTLFPARRGTRPYRQER